MRDEFCEKLAALALASLTAGTALTTGAFGVAAFATALTLPAVWSRYCNWAECAEKRAFKTAAKEARAAFDALIAGGEFKSDEHKPAETALAGVVEKLAINPDAMKAAKWNEALLINAVMQSAQLVAAHDYAPGHDVQKNANRRLLELQWQATLKALKALPDFEAKVMPAFRRDVMEALADIKTDTEAIRDDIALLKTEFEGQFKAQGIALREAELALFAANADIGLTRAFLSFVLKKQVAADQFSAAIAEAIAAWARSNPEIDKAFSGNLLPGLEALRAQARAAYADNQIDGFYELRRKIRFKVDVAFRELQNQTDAMLDVLKADLDEEMGAATAALNAKGVADCLVRQMELETPDATLRFKALRSIQDNWYVRGRDKGINFDLEVSIHLAKALQGIAANADQRGSAQNDLGVALQTVGERESSTENLIEAVKAYRAALEERTRDRVPLKWATTQNNLGTALQTLGERESGTEKLMEAVKAYRATLEEWTRDRVPLDWAMTQNNLGIALKTLGERESDTETLMEAVKACRAALEERTRDLVPLGWAMTQNNLGNALKTLGQRESGTENLMEAVKAYHAALEVWTRDDVPLYWAMTQTNLAFCEAVFAEHAATVEPMPHWQNALLYIDAALEVYSPQDSAYYYDKATRARSNILAAIAKLEGGSARPS